MRLCVAEMALAWLVGWCSGWAADIVAVDDSEEKMHWLSVLGGNAHGRRRFAAVRGKGTQLKKRATGEDGKDDEEGGGMMLIEPQHMIQSIFLDCDKDNDGALSASEYSAFLRTIGSWGKHKYTDENWVEQWCDHPPRPPAPLVLLVVLARHKKLVSASTLLVPDCAVLCCAVLCCTQAE